MNRLDKMKSLRELIDKLEEQIKVLQTEEDLENPPHEHAWEFHERRTYGYEHYGSVYKCKCGELKDVDDR